MAINLQKGQRVSLDNSMKLGRASVLFSATLTPVEYFLQTLGGGESAKRRGPLLSPRPPGGGADDPV